MARLRGSLLRVRIEPHRVFNGVGADDVQVELPVAPWEAALGAKVTVPTLDGPVEMKIPAGAQGGQRLRLRGQGLNRRGGGRGDQYVRLNIVIPSKLTVKRKSFSRTGGRVPLQCSGVDGRRQTMTMRRYDIVFAGMSLSS